MIASIRTVGSKVDVVFVERKTLQCPNLLAYFKFPGGSRCGTEGQAVYSMVQEALGKHR